MPAQVLHDGSSKKLQLNNRLFIAASCVWRRRVVQSGRFPGVSPTRRACFGQDNLDTLTLCRAACVRAKASSSTIIRRLGQFASPEFSVDSNNSGGFMRPPRHLYVSV